MPYLNLDLDFYNHPKTLRLVGILGRGAESLPPKLWCYAGKFHTDDGFLKGYSDAEVESILGWWGDQGKLVEAMLKVGFLERDIEGLQIHDWKEHSGHLSALKQRAKKAAASRWNKIESSSFISNTTSNTISNATSNAKQDSKQCLTNAPQEEGIEGIEGLPIIEDKDKNKSSMRQFTDYFTMMFEAKFGDKYHFRNAIDGQAAKRLSTVYEFDKLKRLVKTFFESSDQFIAEAGFTIGVFETQINKLTVNARKVTQADKVRNKTRSILSGEKI